ncbi:MAG: trigger factor [Clostridia bacterium]
MNYTLDKLEKSQVKFTIDINAEELELAIEEAYHKTKGKFKVEGFRQGKAPRKVIESMYGKGAFIDEAIDIILPKYFSEAMDKEPEIEPVGRPEADIIELTDTTFKYAVTITVKPEVKLGEYKGLTVAKESVEVTDEAVQAELILAQDKNARVVEVEGDVESKIGDIVNIDFSGSVDGVKFDGGSGEGYDLELGSNTFIPGFEEQVVGVKKGDEKEITVKFPADYGAENLAGKDAVFAVKANAIKKKELPAMDDDFAKDVSEFDTLEAYRADIKAGLVKQAEEQAEIKEENARIDAIVANCEVEVPECMITEQAEEMIKEFEYRLMYQGMKIDDYCKYTGTTREQMSAEYKEPAARNVKIRLILEAIIKAEDIKPDEAEIEKQIAEMAKTQNKEVEVYKKEMDPRNIGYLYNQNVSEILMAKLKEYSPAV